MQGEDTGVEKTVEARAQIGFGDVLLQRESYPAPIDTIRSGSNDHHLQMSMTPILPPSMACFPDIWGPDRFEPMGDMFLLPAGSALHARGQRRVLQTLVCQLNPGPAAQWLGTDIEWTERHLKAMLDINSRDIRHLMHRVSDELLNPGFASEAKIELVVAQVCIELTRYLWKIDEDLPSRGLPGWRLRLIDDYLADNPGAATLTAVARLCGLSVRHLTRAFRASMGKSIGTYIAEHRVRFACKMLANGASVKETAYAAGFSAPTNFATAFRRETGRFAFRRQASCIDPIRANLGDAHWR
jgi:AraC family transcriptional regulator